MYDLMYKYMFAGFVIASGFFMGFTIVSHFVYKPMIEDSRELYLTDEEIEINEYIKKYDEEYEELESNDITEDNLKELSKNYLTEETPEGVVKMYYCSDSESFVYWCEKQIPYKLLETVSKKYVIEYDCKTIHVDMNYELEQKRKALMEAVDKNIIKNTDDKNTDDKNTDDKNTDDKNTDDNDSVFVSFKNYKKPDITKTSPDKINKTNDKKLLVCDKANRYSYRGPYVKKEDKPKTGEMSVKNISFSEFMKAKNTFNNINNNINNINESNDSDGFWRFLDVKNDIKKYSESITNNIKGTFIMNGTNYDNIKDYHKAVMEELKATVSCNSSDNSYDVLECDNDIVNDEKKTVEDLSNNLLDTSDDSSDDDENKLKQVASTESVQSGNRISRGGSVDSQDSQSRGWLW